jgi:fucose permease
MAHALDEIVKRGQLLFAIAVMASGVAANWMAHWGATLLGTMFLLWVLLLHSPRVARASVSRSPNTPTEWSSAFIALAMCGGAWISAWHFRRKEDEEAIALERR